MRSSNTSLQFLAIGERRVEGPTNIILSSLLENQTLKKMVLCQDKITPDKGLEHRLAELLQSGTSALAYLVLDKVHFKQEWRVIFEALEVNHALKVLEVNRCNNLDLVFNDLMKLLEINITIEEIDLQSTELRDKGKIPIVEQALQRNKRQADYMKVLKQKLPLSQPSTGRLFLCGTAHAGKSTLRETMVRYQQRHGCIEGIGAFMRGQPGLRWLRPRTEGIEIKVLRNEGGMQISVWDMAGQEHYHVLHDYLFPNTNQACVFAVVYNPCCNQVTLPTKDFEEKLLYWLRFIASNARCPGHVLPSVCIIITNLDRLQARYTRDSIKEWASQVVKSVRREFDFDSVIQIAPTINVVTAYSTASVQDVVEHVFQEFEELLQHRLSPVFKACGDMSLALARRTLDYSAKPAPIVRLEAFYTLCSDSVEALRDLFDDRTTQEGQAVKEYVARARQAVTAYLHDVGSIIHFQALDLVVVNPNWLGNVFLPNFMRSGARGGSTSFLQSTEDGLVERHDLCRILENILKTGGPQLEGFTVDDLLQLLLKLELCHEEDTASSATTRYFVPNSMPGHQNTQAAHQPSTDSTCSSCIRGPDAPEISSTSPTLELNWTVRMDGVAEATVTGTRLQSNAKGTKFLTAGFFPRLQVRVHVDFFSSFHFSIQFVR